MKKYMIGIVGKTIPYIWKVFDSKDEAREFIKVLEEQDRTVLNVSIEYYIKEVE